jgi:glycosyltransferase involved in cell wall biosynthesis
VRIAYIADAFVHPAERAALDVQRAVAHLRDAGHQVQLVRPRRPREATRHDATEWRVRSGAGSPLNAVGGLVLDAALREEFEAPGLAPEHVHVATSGPLAWKALLAAKACGLRTSADCSDPTRSLCGRETTPLLWRGPMRLPHLRRLHALADMSFVPTEALAGALKRQGLERLQVIGRGVDSEQFAPQWRDAWQRQSWGAGADRPVLLYAGPLSRAHNVELALSTWERLRSVGASLCMVVVGDGPLRAQLQGRYPQVRFAGARHGSDLARHLASADLLLPAAEDDVGDTLLEGLASGLVLVACDTAAARAHLGDGGGGFVARQHPAGAEADTFVAAARHALASWQPDGPRRMMARAAALQASWPPVLARFERALRASAPAAATSGQARWSEADCVQAHRNNRSR